jgi:hypothetical protein
LWLLALPLLAIQPMVWSWRTLAVRLRVEALAARFIAHAVVLARAGFTFGGPSIPEPWSHLLDVFLAAQLAVRALYRVSDVAVLPAHYFSVDAGSEDADVPLVRIEP